MLPEIYCKLNLSVCVKTLKLSLAGLGGLGVGGLGVGGIGFIFETHLPFTQTNIKRAQV